MWFPDVFVKLRTGWMTHQVLAPNKTTKFQLVFCLRLISCGIHLEVTDVKHRILQIYPMITFNLLSPVVHELFQLQRAVKNSKTKFWEKLSEFLFLIFIFDLEVKLLKFASRGVFSNIYWPDSCWKWRDQLCQYIHCRRIVVQEGSVWSEITEGLD